MSSPQEEAALAVERLRLAEARLNRRRQTICGPSENARAAMRFVLERSDEHEVVTPTSIAAHLGVTTASVTGILERLQAGGMITLRPNPDDRRSKVVVPFDRSVDPDDIDPMTAKIRDLSTDLSAHDAAVIRDFVARITSDIDEECSRPAEN